jgi:hypothetical protein
MRRSSWKTFPIDHLEHVLPFLDKKDQYELSHAGETRITSLLGYDPGLRYQCSCCLHFKEDCSCLYITLTEAFMPECISMLLLGVMVSSSVISAWVISML